MPLQTDDEILFEFVAEAMGGEGEDAFFALAG